jgi:putative DNA primase/helicase
MVDDDLVEIFERINNRTGEEMAGLKQIARQKQKEEINLNLRNLCWGFIADRKEDHCSERLVEAIEARYSIYTTRDDLKPEVWIYNNGIYEPNGESFIREFVREILLHLATPQRVNKVIFKVVSDTMIDVDEFFNIKYIDEICVENGILNLETKELSAFTPNKIFFNKIPVKFDPNSKCPNIDRFFSDVLKDKDDKKVLYELAGFCLHKDYFIEKAFMFVGGGRNGKSKTLGLLKRFLGVKNACSVSLIQMAGDSTALCELHNRLVCLSGDLDNSSLKTTGLFKELTGRDTVQVKRKYLRDLIFVNYAKIVFACNELPRVYDMSLGFWSRWVLLEFPYEFLPEDEIVESGGGQFKKIQDPDVLDKIATPNELSGLLNKAIEGLERLKKNKDFSYSRGTSSVKDFWIRSSDSFTAFCLDMIEEDVEKNISKKNLRKVFNQYCKKHKVGGTSDKNIKAVLENLFGVVEVKHGADYERFWEGIGFKDQKVSNRQGRHRVSKTLGNGDFRVLGDPCLPCLFEQNEQKTPGIPKKSSYNPETNQNLNKSEEKNEKDWDNQSNLS